MPDVEIQVGLWKVRDAARNHADHFHADYKAHTAASLRGDRAIAVDDSLIYPPKSSRRGPLKRAASAPPQTHPHIKNPAVAEATTGRRGRKLTLNL